MVAINANMDNAQDWIPLSEADANALAQGFYTLDDESLEVGGVHRTLPPPAGGAGHVANGRVVKRGVAGSAKASHTSGATLTRYYPDAPGGGETFSGGTITEPLVIQGPIGGGVEKLLDVQGDSGSGVASHFSIVTDPNGDGSFVRGGSSGLTVYRGVWVQAGVGQGSSLFQAFDENGDPVFSVDADGSVHIKTGTTIQADL